jgi:hypothetical protein
LTVLKVVIVSTDGIDCQERRALATGGDGGSRFHDGSRYHGSFILQLQFSVVVSFSPLYSILFFKGDSDTLTVAHTAKTQIDSDSDSLSLSPVAVPLTGVHSRSAVLASNIATSAGIDTAGFPGPEGPRRFTHLEAKQGVAKQLICEKKRRKIYASADVAES